MKKLKCEVHYPWAGIESDIEYLEIEEKQYAAPLSQKDLEEMAMECIEEMVWNRVSVSWEEVTE